MAAGIHWDRFQCFVLGCCGQERCRAQIFADQELIFDMTLNSRPYRSKMRQVVVPCAKR